MLRFAKALWNRSHDQDTAGGYSFSRPLVLLQSDDWGRVGVRDREGYERLRADGIKLGERPYDLYTLETADDLTALHDMLKRHRDSTGRAACVVMNFVLANLDFPKMAAGNFQRVHLLPLALGLPGNWKRPGLFEAYRQGIANGVFFPALHGLTHFCCRAVEHMLAKDGDRAELLSKFWRAETPYIHWRMPWIGYEYYNPDKPQAGFLPAEMQQDLIRKAADVFQQFFAAAPVSACAPGYRANSDTHRAWASCGIRVAQNGSGAPLPPQMDEFEILNLHRTIDFEPSQRDLPLEKYVQLADDCFAHGMPTIISVHSINFHSSLKDFRSTTLQALDQFLTALEAKYPNLLYANDGDVYDLVTHGKYRAAHGWVSMEVKRQAGGQSWSVAGGAR